MNSVRVIAVGFVVLASLAGAAVLTLPGRDEVGDQEQARSRTIRASPLLVALGDQVLAYGGFGEASSSGAAGLPVNDSSVLDPATGTERVVDPAPFSAGLTPPPAGVAVADDAVIVGTVCERFLPDSPVGECGPGTYEAAVFDGREGRWRRLEMPPELQSVVNGWRRAFGATSDGRAAFLLGPYADPQIWVLDVARNTWDHVTSPPGRIQNGCLAGDVLVMAQSEAFSSGSFYTGNLPAGSTQPYLSLLDLSAATSGWVRTEPAPVEGHDLVEPQVTCLDAIAVIDDGTGSGPAAHRTEPHDASDDWIDVPEPPTGTFLDIAAVDGTTLLFLDAGPTSSRDGASHLLAFSSGQPDWQSSGVGSTGGAPFVIAEGRVVFWPSPDAGLRAAGLRVADVSLGSGMRGEVDVAASRSS